MDVGAWLRGLGLGQYEVAFRDNAIDVEVLPDLTDADLAGLGVLLGHRKKILRAIAALHAQAPGERQFPLEAISPPPSVTTLASEAERRQLTVMFVDLVGSTELAGRLDPEEMGAVLRAYHGRCTEVVGRWEGHVAKFMGDGVLAYFGYPRAHEDDAERAVRAGLDLTEAVACLNAGAGGPPLTARVGIATGLVMVGELVGDGPAQERAVVGETPNLAARLQALAEPGAVVIAPGTRRLLGGLFDLADLGIHHLKGLTAPTRAWRVLGPGAAEGRFEARYVAGLTPLVGREGELALLLDRWERAGEGEGQVVLLSGEAGIGKSRLVRALRERLAGEPHTWLGQFCSPYHANTALHPVIGLLERAAELRRDDPPEQQLDRLEAMLTLATEDVREAAPLLADLLAVRAIGRYQPLQLSPQQKKERTFQMLLGQLAGLAVREPVLALYEDVHWADPTTLELLGRVVERVQRLAVLAVITFRPEFVPPWAGHGHVTALALSRLGRRQGGAIVGRVAGKALPPEVLEQILARADGVPLFAEELTKAVLESGLLADRGDRYELEGPLPPLAIPATLQDSLMARLDRLAPVKEVAQVAACVGREFSHGLLAAVAGLGDDELGDALDRLIGAGLIFRRGEGAAASYAFKHALVRDAAYQSLLKGRRQQLHARIAEALEEHFPEIAAAEPELVARHHAGAGSAERAIGHWRRAAELAIGRSANLEAIAHCAQAEAQLRAVPPSAERTRAELEILLAKGVAVRAARGYSAPEAERVFLRACELCEELGDRVRLVHALRGLWAFYEVAARWRDAARIADRLHAAATGLEDRVVLTVRDYAMGTTLLFRGEPAGAARWLRSALHRYDEDDRDAHIKHSGHDAATLVRGHLCLAQWFLGQPEQALRTSKEGLEIARRVAHPFSLAQMLAFSAIVCALLREWATAEALGAEAREISARYGLATHLALGAIATGIAASACNATSKGADLIREGMAALHRTGGGFFTPLALSGLALTLLASGDADAALEVADEAVRVARGNEEFCWEAEALRVRGEVRRAASAAGGAEVDLRAAIEIARRQAASALELRAATSLGRLWAAGGERQNAHDVLAPIYGRFTEGFDTPDLRDARVLLDALR